jgi:hypothetical protein
MLSYTIPAPRTKSGSATKVADELSAVENRFLRIANELCRLWESPEADHYIDSLLLDDRGDRMGFPIEVLDDLMFLAGVRWHRSHLCGTMIETTTAEPFSSSGSRVELCGGSSTWVLV